MLCTLVITPDHILHPQPTLINNRLFCLCAHNCISPFTLYIVVRARMPASGLIGIRMVIIGIRLQTWMRVIVDVDVYVRLSLEIYGSWRADYIEWPLPGQGHVPPLQYPPL
jgi:hypothetical protein